MYLGSLKAEQAQSVRPTSAMSIPPIVSSVSWSIHNVNDPSFNPTPVLSGFGSCQTVPAVSSSLTAPGIADSSTSTFAPPPPSFSNYDMSQPSTSFLVPNSPLPPPSVPPPTPFTPTPLPPVPVVHTPVHSLPQPSLPLPQAPPSSFPHLSLPVRPPPSALSHPHNPLLGNQLLSQ